MMNSEPASRAAFRASAAFFSVASLKSMAGPAVQAAMSTLHRTLREAMEPLSDSSADPVVRILSSLTGAIVLVPDALNCNLHDILPDAVRAISAAGIAVRVGVSRSDIQMIVDADNRLNAIGRCINIAARLAVSNDNPGILYHELYANHVQTLLPRTHFLHPQHAGGRPPVYIKGKRTEVFTCFADPEIIPLATFESDQPVSRFQNAILLAYDLPDFSDGDLRTLASRFRSVVQEVQRLREEQDLRGVGIYFSPGGDGGVLALTQVPPGRALPLATELADLLAAAGTTQSADAPVQVRIGVHYGQVLSYENAEGVTRPTGLALFDADGLAGDEEARRYQGVVISDALIESAAKGVAEGHRFEKIGPFTTAQGTTIQRYVPTGTPRAYGTGAAPDHGEAAEGSRLPESATRP
jgi:class 3 adenylate cyclase